MVRINMSREIANYINYSHKGMHTHITGLQLWLATIDSAVEIFNIMLLLLILLDGQEYIVLVTTLTLQCLKLLITIEYNRL